MDNSAYVEASSESNKQCTWSYVHTT